MGDLEKIKKFENEKKNLDSDFIIENILKKYVKKKKTKKKIKNMDKCKK